MTNKSPKLFCFRTIILNKGIYPNTTNNIPYCIGLKVIQIIVHAIHLFLRL